jgi:Ricin-type beta-trefoil lectin domain
MWGLFVQAEGNTGLNRLRRMAASVAVTGLSAVGGVVASAAVASAGTIGSCTAEGDYATCVASGTANKPLTITVSVTSSPDQTVYVAWDTVCTLGTGAGSSSGSFTANTPVTRTISHPYHQPDSCIVSADAQLQNGGNKITVTIASSSALPPPKPVVKAIRGYGGKCVDDPANSSAKGIKIELWSCDTSAAQNWALRGGQLQHNGKCANDAGNGGSGGSVILYTCTKASNDIWTHKSNGEYVLKAHSGKLCLTDPGYSTKNGTKLVVYTCKDTANQRWTLP